MLESREGFQNYVSDCRQVDEMFSELCGNAENTPETEEDFERLEDVLAGKLKITREALHDALLVAEVFRAGSEQYADIVN